MGGNGGLAEGVGLVKLKLYSLNEKTKGCVSKSQREMDLVCTSRNRGII